MDSFPQQILFRFCFQTSHPPPASFLSSFCAFLTGHSDCEFRIERIFQRHWSRLRRYDVLQRSALPG